MSRLSRVSAQSITRPADVTAYASGDLVANSTTAGSVTPFLFSPAVNAGGKGNVHRLGVKASQDLLANGSFRVHIFTAAPTVANGDNAALAIATNIDNYVGYVDVTLSATGAGGAIGWGVPVWNDALPFKSTTGNLWALLEARAAYVPASAQTFQVLMDLEAPDGDF